ncbi:MAG TPA: class I SAM-dependent methyltransferase [Gemmataceae bacterium]|nr:class I SAM-dependent methyltransferase [Gemmataceae bacterium]
MPAGSTTLVFPIAWMTLWPGIGLVATGALMIYSSKIGKLRERERLLDLVPWNGDELVLDMGCGRGLLLIGAAKRLTTGKSVGIDLWQAEDLSGNRLEATLENAQREGVADRVEVHTGDMRQLPFANQSFDVIVSRAAIHNIYDPKERARALTEIARVLKPGGYVVISDVRHAREYIAALQGQGLQGVRRVTSAAPLMFYAILTAGNLRPASIVGRKPPS